MTDQRDTPEFGYFERVNSDLMHSLRRCHALVDDCRGKLAANSNEPQFMFAEDAPKDEIDGERHG